MSPLRTVAGYSEGYAGTRGSRRLGYEAEALTYVELSL